MPQQTPQMAQWTQRHQAALAAVKQAEASRDPQRVRQAYDSLRQVTTAKPDGQATAPGRKGQVPQPRQGILSVITNALSGN